MVVTPFDVVVTVVKDASLSGQAVVKIVVTPLEVVVIIDSFCS